MEFVLFLLVNIALFLRPQDLFAELASVPIYNVLIVVNLLVAAPLIVRLVLRGLKRAPAILCVAGILAAIVVSLAARSDLYGAWFGGVEFLKVAAYFLLMVAVLNTPRRLTIYLASVVTLTVMLAGLSIAHFHGYLYLPAITHAREIKFDAGGTSYDFFRLASFGVFADPNDLSMIIVLSMMICLGAMFYKRLGLVRVAVVVPFLFLGYGLALTQSRGGLLALMAGLMAFFVSRMGMLRSTWALAAAVPLVLLAFGGRQADIGGAISQGTGSQRTDLWYSGLQMIKWSPIVGIGHGRFAEEAGLVAHNSYVQALAEWGLPGGTMFIGLFYVVLWSVWRLRQVRQQIASPPLRGMQPCVMGALAAYAVSMITLTRCDVVPTYLVAGLGVSYEQLARRGTTLRPLEFTTRLFLQMALITFCFLAALYIYIRFIYRLLH
jgi:O-antigen ligase